MWEAHLQALPALIDTGTVHKMGIYRTPLLDDAESRIVRALRARLLVRMASEELVARELVRTIEGVFLGAIISSM